MQFTILRPAKGGYPLEVHRFGCQDAIRRIALQPDEADWNITGDSVDAAVQSEAAELNSQFDRVYPVEELFRVFPCCKI